MGKDNPKDKVPRLPAPADEARRQLDVLVRALPGRRTMIEDIIRRNRDAAHIPRVRLYGGTATEREAWVDWYDRDLLKARAVADLDRRLPAPPTVGETARESYRQLERWCSDVRRVVAKGTRPSARRRKVPEATQAKVLISSARRCCLCFGLSHDLTEKPGQIAHINHDPTNIDLDNLVWLCLEHHDQYDSSTSQSKGITAGEVREHRASLYRELQVKAPEPDSGESPSEPTTTSAGAAGPVERAERRDSLLRQLGECIEQGESIRGDIRIERGRLRERWVIGRDEGRSYQEPNREIVDGERFVEWRTTCATVLGDLIPTAHPIHGSLPCQFNDLPCGAGQLRWSIAKLRAIKTALQQGFLDA